MLFVNSRALVVRSVVRGSDGADQGREGGEAQVHDVAQREHADVHVIGCWWGTGRRRCVVVVS